MPAFERIAAGQDVALVEDACEALGAVHGDGHLVGTRGHLSVFAFYPNKQLTTGEGGASSDRGPRRRRRASTPSATRAARRTWTGSTTTGSASTTGSRTSPARWGWPSSSASTPCWLAARELAELYTRRFAGVEGIGLPCADEGGDRRSWFVYVVQVPSRRRTRRDDRGLRERGIESKPYLPAIHLMSYYRERVRPPRGRVPGM